ncbi:MAG: hypothetical protein ACD_47C00159G0002 [uncultured bacterium]|nr:MAG: hypothetical protein ACD_47C00159G0002 [uncultured bacterium]
MMRVSMSADCVVMALEPGVTFLNVISSKSDIPSNLLFRRTRLDLSSWSCGKISMDFRVRSRPWLMLVLPLRRAPLKNSSMKTMKLLFSKYAMLLGSFFMAISKYFLLFLAEKFRVYATPSPLAFSAAK